MFIDIDYHSGLPIYKQILNQIKLLVSTGKLKKNDKIPSVRELASLLKVNPTSITRAYRELEHDEVIYTKKGSGTYISPEANKLAKNVKLRMINKRIQQLLAEANQMGLSKDEIKTLFQEQIKKIVE